MKFYLTIVACTLFGAYSMVYGQDSLDSSYMDGCYKPNLMVSHPLGQFISKINHNFRTKPVDRISIHVGITNSNVWLPEVREYYPISQEKTELLSNFIWHKRDSVYQIWPSPYDSTSFSADGVMRTFNLTVTCKTSTYSELEIHARGMLLSNGVQPMSFLTSDKFIEQFHSNIKGGEDPFARKVYGFNQAGIQYQDLEGKRLKINRGQFIVPGVQLNYYAYAHSEYLKQHSMQLSVGVHAGVNLPIFVRSVDAGFSGVFQKQYKLGKKHAITWVVAGSLLRQKIWKVKDHIDFSRNKMFGTAESMIEYRNYLPKNRHWAVGLNFTYLTPYSPISEYDRITPVGKRISSHWHLASTHMYVNSQYWTLLFSYHRTVTWSFFVAQDFKVNNAPDFQTGYSVEVPISTLKRKKSSL